MSLSSPGIGSGLDVNGIVSQLMALERQPLAALAQRESAYKTRLSTLGTLKSALDALQSAAASLESRASVPSFTATVSDTAVLSASAGSAAAAGTHSLTVTRLAQSQILVAAGQAAADAPIGSGAPTTLTLEFGTTSGASFSADASRDPIVVTLDGTNHTLEGIRDAINTAADGAVTASIVNDGSDSPYRLVIRSETSGAAGSLRLSVAGDASLEALLAHDPAGAQNLTQTRAAQDALFTVDGIQVSKASNTVTDAIAGVTLTLKSAGSSELTIVRDSSPVKSALESFVAAYNTVHNAIAAATGLKAVAQGDATLISVQRQLRAALGSPQAVSGAFTALAEIGVALEKDGTLAIDADRLNTVLAEQPDDVLALAAAFGASLEALAGDLSGADGVVALARDGVNQRLETLNDQRAALETRLEAIEARYRAQFTALDTMLAGLSSTASFLQQQLAVLSTPKS